MDRRAIGIFVAAVAVAATVAGPASATAVSGAGGPSGATCTWGGTPDAATGTVLIKPGVTNTPSTRPLKILAEGGMDCSNGFSGDVTFDGVIQTGGTCAAQIFDGKIKGLPGVARAFG